jgi:hypothetical protein
VNKVELVRRWLTMVVAILLAIAVSSPRTCFGQRVPSVTAAQQPSEPLTDAERKAIVAKLTPLQERLAALRSNPDVKPDHWADAQIFDNGRLAYTNRSRPRSTGAGGWASASREFARVALSSRNVWYLAIARCKLNTLRGAARPLDHAKGQRRC